MDTNGKKQQQSETKATITLDFNHISQLVELLDELEDTDSGLDTYKWQRDVASALLRKIKRQLIRALPDEALDELFEED